MLKLTKFPPPFGGGFTFSYTSHILKRFIPHVHRARPLNEFENGSMLAENRIEYVLPTSWDENSIFFSAKRARPCSQTPVRKISCQMGLLWNRISWGMRKKHLRSGNRFDSVKGVTNRTIPRCHKMIETSSSESWWLVQDLPLKSILMACTEKVSNFLRNIQCVLNFQRGLAVRQSHVNRRVISAAV